MKKLLTFATLALGLHGAVMPAASAAEYLTAPSDPLASDATRNVYDYLRTRRGQPENRVIEGQFLGMINQILYPGQRFYGIFDINQHVIDGKLPALAGSRYDGEDKETGEYRLDADIVARVNAKLIETWNDAQPIIHLTATPRNPWNQQLGREPDDANTQKIGRLLRAATNLSAAQKAIRAKFWADIDVIAGGLQQLEDAGIPVMFRPFAEFNQTNKYYFAKQTPADFLALWKEVYHYYTDEPPAGKGLHNLLFCWEVWALNRNEASATIGPWYPGDNYADVVAGAFYFKPDTPELHYLDPVTGQFSFAHSDPEDAPVYEWLISQRRPFGAAQYGLNQDTNTPGDHEFTRRFMDFSPDLAFVFYWNQYQAVEKQENKSLFVADDRVATHNDLPIFAQFPATVTLSNLSQTYTGAPRVVTATTAPAGLSVSLTYDGSTTMPTDAGSYAVVGTITDPHFIGSASDTLVVAKAAAAITLGNLVHAYDGTPKSATATTEPAGLRRFFRYDGSSKPPTAVGSYMVVCTINEPNYAGSATGTLTIVDVRPPVLALPNDLVLEATGPAGAVATFAASASDDVDGSVPVSLWPASGSVFPLGTTPVDATASDAAGNRANGSFTVTVRDTTTPAIETLVPSTTELWPANHRMVAVTLSATASDLVGVASLRISAVTSNEPDDGLGDGDTAGDIEVTGPLALNLRAERSGGGDGRVYTIVVEARDLAGNATTRTTTVAVPKSRDK